MCDSLKPADKTSSRWHGVWWPLWSLVTDIPGAAADERGPGPPLPCPAVATALHELSERIPRLYSNNEKQASQKCRSRSHWWDEPSQQASLDPTVLKALKQGSSACSSAPCHAQGSGLPQASPDLPSWFSSCFYLNDPIHSVWLSFTC